MNCSIIDITYVRSLKCFCDGNILIKSFFVCKCVAIQTFSSFWNAWGLLFFFSKIEKCFFKTYRDDCHMVEIFAKIENKKKSFVEKKVTSNSYGSNPKRGLFPPWPQMKRKTRSTLQQSNRKKQPQPEKKRTQRKELTCSPFFNSQKEKKKQTKNCWNWK